LVDPSIFFHLISSDNRDATTSYSAKVVKLLLISMTKPSHESRKKHNRIIHFSPSVILISTNDNWYIIVLNALKCSITKLPSLIFRRYSLFVRNNLFTKDFDRYKLPKLSHSFLVEPSPEKFSNTKSARHSRIILLAFFRFSPIFHSIYMLEWYLERLFPIILDIQEYIQF